MGKIKKTHIKLKDITLDVIADKFLDIEKSKGEVNKITISKKHTEQLFKELKAKTYSQLIARIFKGLEDRNIIIGEFLLNVDESSTTLFYNGSR